MGRDHPSSLRDCLWNVALGSTCEAERAKAGRDFPRRADQADALRFGRLSDSMAQVGHSIEYAGVPEQALAEDARRRQILGPNVDIRLYTYDETNCRVRADRINRMIRKTGGRALIGLVGVQSNQYPRASISPASSGRPGTPVDRRVSCVGLHRNVARASAGNPRGAGHGRFIVCRRGGKRQVRRTVSGTPGRERLAPLYNHMNDLAVLAG